MFDRWKRFARKIAASLEETHDSAPRPQRANPDPPKDHWFARVEERSRRAAAAREAEASRVADALVAKASASASRR